MSIPTILPSGQLHPDLVNNAAFVKYVGSGAEAQGGQAGQKIQQPGADALKADSERLSRDFQAGRMDVVDLTSCFAQSSGAADGKTVIQNQPGGGLIVETIDPNVITAEDANKSAAAGGATHGFFYRSTDFCWMRQRSTPLWAKTRCFSIGTSQM